MGWWKNLVLNGAIKWVFESVWWSRKDMQVFTVQGYDGCSCSPCKCSSFWSENCPDIHFRNGQVIALYLPSDYWQPLIWWLNRSHLSETSLNSVEFGWYCGWFLLHIPSNPVPLEVKKYFFWILVWTNWETISWKWVLGHGAWKGQMFLACSFAGTRWTISVCDSFFCLKYFVQCLAAFLFHLQDMRRRLHLLIRTC